MGKDDQKRNKQTERKPTGKLGEGDGREKERERRRNEREREDRDRKGEIERDGE